MLAAGTSCQTGWIPTFGAAPGGVGIVYALTVFDDGSGPALYAGGKFTSPGGLNSIAKWNGASWSPLGSGVSGWLDSVYALAVFDDGRGAALHAGGTFASGPAGDSYLAKWGCPAITSVPGCSGNPAILAALAPSAPLGLPLPLQVTGSAALSGLALVYGGAPGVDASGCGFLLPPYGEFLLALAPPPLLVAGDVLATGTSVLLPFVPSNPALAGVTVYLQGASTSRCSSRSSSPTRSR